MKLHSLLDKVQLYRLLDYNVLQLDDVKHWSSLSGVPVLLAGLPVESASVFIATVPTVPGRSLLTLGDDSELVADETLTTKLGRMNLSGFMPVKLIFFGKEMSNQESVGELSLLRRPKRMLQPEKTASFSSQSAGIKIEVGIISEPDTEPSYFPISRSLLARKSSLLKSTIAKYCPIYDVFSEN